MPGDRYIRIRIGDQVVTYRSVDDIPVGISYQLEDLEDFQVKTSSSALNIKLPASPENDLQGNTYHNPGIEDFTSGEIFKGSLPSVIEANGTEILVGKSFLNHVTHTDKPEYYDRSFFGDNADWLIDLRETTLYDLLKHLTFAYDKANIEGTWKFDGRDEEIPFVWAPVKYGAPIGGRITVGDYLQPVNNNMIAEYLKPSISAYFILFFAFRSIGYRMQSQFFNTDYARHLVMPWTWGNFLSGQGTKYDIHKFNAKSAGEKNFIMGDGNFDEIIDLDFSNDYDPTEGGYDNNGTPGDYTYDPVAKEGTWTYNAPDYGVLLANPEFTLDVDSVVSKTGGELSEFASTALYAQWYKNGVLFDAGSYPFLAGYGNRLFQLNTGIHEIQSFEESITTNALVQVNAGDTISLKFRLLALNHGDHSHSSTTLNLFEFKLEEFRIPFGGTISFDSYYSLKNYKFLDLLCGITDHFNLSWKTDPAQKIVYVEPTHPYSLTNDLSVKSAGYFNDDFIDWSDKQDLSKESQIDLYRDYEREVTMKFKDDANDGILKKLQDRHQLILASSKYVFPERFKSGKKDIENRFFAPVVHCSMEQWKGITTYPAQMVCMVPENISNTSASEAENTFIPRLCYYKGIVPGIGWKYEGETKTDYPFMFAVNYLPGGEQDPILSYSDENIKDGNTEPGKFIIGKGLLKRFFWQRLAIMRNGQWYTTWFQLNNNDVANNLHREHIIVRGQKWQLIQIDNYQPLMEETTKCVLYKWSPVTDKDNNATFPSASSIQTGEVSFNSFDIKYIQAKCLPTDIPNI